MNLPDTNLSGKFVIFSVILSYLKSYCTASSIDMFSFIKSHMGIFFHRNKEVERSVFTWFYLSCRITLLLGPPGCGKTSLLKALSGTLNQSLKVSHFHNTENDYINHQNEDIKIKRISKLNLSTFWKLKFLKLKYAYPLALKLNMRIKMNRVFELLTFSMGCTLVCLQVLYYFSICFFPIDYRGDYL